MDGIERGIPSAVRAVLPKSKLVWIRRRYTPTLALGSRRIWRAKFRNANAMFVWLGPLEIGWRMPWLERSARALHPHLFAQGTSAFGRDRNGHEAKPAGPVAESDAPNPNPLNTPPKTEGPTQ